SGIAGAVRVDPLGGVHIEDVKARVGDALLNVNLQLNQGRPEATMQFRAGAEGLELNSDLFEYMPSGLDAVKKLFVERDGLKLGGTLNVEARGVRRGDEAYDVTDLTLHIRNGTLGLELLDP